MSSGRPWWVGFILGLVLVGSIGLVPAGAASAATSAAVARSPSTQAAAAVLRSSRNPLFQPSLLPASTPRTRSTAMLPVAPAVVPAVLAPSSPVLRASWNGLGSTDNANLTAYPSVSPPDVQVAVGPTHVVEMVNLVVSMWTKSGVRVYNASLMSFFGTPANEFISDPKVQYDAASGHWFATITDVATSSNVATGQVILAVSTGADPTGTWRLLKVPSAATGECLDQPILGVGSSTVVISVNNFSTCLSNSFTYNGAQYWVLSKADLVSGSPSPATQSFGPFGTTASIHPAQTIGASTTDYLVDANAFQTSVNAIELFRVTGVPPSASVSMTNLSVRAITNPPAATQPGGGGVLPLDTGDFRILDAAWSAGNLWLTLTDGCMPAGDPTTRSCVRLIELNTTTTSVTQDFDLSAAGRYYLYPSLRADGKGNLLVVFGYSSSIDYPGLMVAGRVFGDPLDQLDPPVVIMVGATDQGLGCSTSAHTCRYGDYFGAGLDPSNSSIIWAAGEFGVGSGWGTQIFAASVKAVLTLSYSVVNGGTGYALPTLSYTLDGVSRSTTLSLTPTSYAVDPGTAWSVPVLLLNPSIHVNQTSEIWALNVTEPNLQFRGTVNGSLSANFAYFHMYVVTFGFRVSDNGTGATPMIQVVRWGLHVWAQADATFYVDAGSPFLYPATLNESTSNERWILEGPANGTVTAPSTFAGLYYHQYRVTFDYVLSDGSASPSPSVHFYSYGTNISVQANATVWADAAWPYVYASTLTGEGGGARIGAKGETVGNVSWAGLHVVLYGLQYLLTVSAQPGSLAGTISGAGWYDVGSLANLTATASAGWKFVGWSGAAVGNVAATSVTMSAPENVTALFYPGLTIIAGDGGSVAYSWGSMSGTVAAGTNLTIYAPAGTAITLVAQPSSLFSAFGSWSGGATGSAATTSVTMNAPTTVSASFGSNTLVYAGIAGGVIAVILAALLLLLIARRRKKQQPPA